MRAVIVGSGKPVDKELLRERCSEADIIIAADGGGLYLYESGIVPDVLLGDFDSIPGEVLDFFRAQKGVKLLNFPVRKDYTDTELALETALDMGADEICFLSATGSRLDHSLSNILLLVKLLDRNAKGWIEDENNRVYVFRGKGRIELKRLDNWKVSLIPISPEVRGVTTEGLLYQLKNYDMKLGHSLGISNEFIADTASVSFDEGFLMVILSRDDNPGKNL